MRRPSPVRGKLWVVLATAVVVVGLDQLTKTLAEHFLSSGPAHVIGPLDLSLGYNSGFAFSLGRGLGPALVAVALVLICLLVLVGRKAPSLGVALAVGMILGGAVGNLLDRLIRSHGGAVIDFIELHFWPTFNVADSFIVIGAVLLAIMALRGRV